MASSWFYFTKVLLVENCRRLRFAKAMLRLNKIENIWPSNAFLLQQKRLHCAKLLMKQNPTALRLLLTNLFYLFSRTLLMATLRHHHIYGVYRFPPSVKPTPSTLTP